MVLLNFIGCVFFFSKSRQILILRLIHSFLFPFHIFARFLRILILQLLHLLFRLPHLFRIFILSPLKLINELFQFSFQLSIHFIQSSLLFIIFHPWICNLIYLLLEAISQHLSRFFLILDGLLIVLVHFQILRSHIITQLLKHGFLHIELGDLRCELRLLGFD